MPSKKDARISAQVILRPASGRTIVPQTPIDSGNLALFLPSPAAAIATADALRAGGLETGPPVAVSLSVSGTVAAFEKFFDAQIRLGGDGVYEFVREGRSLGPELSGDQLPTTLRGSVQTVAFIPPPAFGPTDFDR
jgi:hypothetical protein